jgi:hypothetical protein
MDIPPKLEELFQQSMANIDGTSERISDHDLRVIGVYGFRDLLRQESDTWLNHSPEGGRAEHIVSKFEKKRLSFCSPAGGAV